jgi:hypothetical protein
MGFFNQSRNCVARFFCYGFILNSAAKKKVSQHPDRFWTLTCFDDSCWFRRAFDVKPLGLASLSNYLSIHMWIIENRVWMRPGHPFYCRLVLMAETDSNSDWTGPLAWLRRPCWPPKVVDKRRTSKAISYVFSIFLGACSNLGLGHKDV